MISTAERGHERTITSPDTVSRRAWMVWAVGLAAYVVAVLHRTSLGVSGTEAAHRFSISATTLASFVVLQLLVYAGMQVPVGMLLDRFGARRLIVAGGSTMAVGQFVLAVDSDLRVAILARVLVGMGDAATFISVLRLVHAWFPPRRVPLVDQITGLTGQLGQVLSAVPLVALLHGPGWTAAFGSAAALGVVVTVLAAALLRDAPPGHPAPENAPGLRDVRRELVHAWRHPGTRLGLWTHFTTQFSGTVFALLWGFPFLVSGERLSPRAASALLSLYVLAGIATAPAIGVLVARHPLRRSWLVLGITAATALTWAVVLAHAGPAPRWLLVALVLVLALGGPGSMIGFDYARTFNPPHRLGTATGIVNVGGFLASLSTIFLVGVVLDAATPGRTHDYPLAAFRAALSVQFVVWAVGVVGVLRTRRLARRRLAEQGIVVPPIREAIARHRAAGHRAAGRRARRVPPKPRR